MHTEVPEIKISYEPSKRYFPLQEINNPKEAEEVLRKYCFPSDEICYRERFVMVALSNSNVVLGHFLIGIGGLTSTVADIRNVMQAALKSNCKSIIVAHNHPSGQLKPSNEDLKLTAALKRGLGYFNITLADHVIITAESAFSFKTNHVL